MWDENIFEHQGHPLNKVTYSSCKLFLTLHGWCISACSNPDFCVVACCFFTAILNYSKSGEFRGQTEKVKEMENIIINEVEEKLNSHLKWLHVYPVKDYRNDTQKKMWTYPFVRMLLVCVIINYLIHYFSTCNDIPRWLRW